MSSGRRSKAEDPKDILVVDPKLPPAEKRVPKHLTKKQKAVFVKWGFTKALLNEVICDSGWDQVDINNYVLRYNGMVNPEMAHLSPELDLDMRRSIQTVIRARLVMPAGTKPPSAQERTLSPNWDRNLRRQANQSRGLTQDNQSQEPPRVMILSRIDERRPSRRKRRMPCVQTREE